MLRHRRLPRSFRNPLNRQDACCTAARIAGISLVAVALAAAGCRKPDEIVEYKVARPPVRETKADALEKPDPAGSQPAHESAAEDPAAGDAATRDQLLGAIIPRGTTTWFFKLTGPAAAVESQQPAFLQFVKSIRFSAKAPEWGLPKGWKEEPGSAMRFATLRITTADEPLEMSVIPLPNGPGPFDDYLLSNVNRWREQLKLGPLSSADLPEKVVKIELGETPVWLVNFKGRLTNQPMGAAPFAGKSAARPAAPPAGPSRAPLPFTCEVPQGWVAVNAGSMQLAAYEVRDGGRLAKISVAVAGGDRAANVNRWRGQIQLAPLPAADLEKELGTLKIDGHDAISVELIGPEKAEPRESILGVVVEAQGRQWFIKLVGDADLAAREKEHFQSFVKSIKFRDKE